MNLLETKLNPNDPHGDYQAKRKALQDIQNDPHTSKDKELQAELIHRKAALEKEYEPHRIKESKSGDAKELISFSQFLKKLKAAGLQGSIAKVAD